MSLVNLVSGLFLFAQTNQPMIYELPLPNGKMYVINREYGVSEQVIFLNSDSAKDVIYDRVSDIERATMIDFGSDGILDYISVIGGDKDTVRTYLKNKKNATIFEKAEKIYKAILDLIYRFKKK
ncbi:MAG: hypothetical protein N3G19_02470 [Candidatus Pacearchaeota archaeon]|nr:hypothetical protein [Candidatus Pacearchaeota archaeon]